MGCISLGDIMAARFSLPQRSSPPTDDEQFWRRVLAGLRLSIAARAIETLFAGAALDRSPTPGV